MIIRQILFTLSIATAALGWGAADDKQITVPEKFFDTGLPDFIGFASKKEGLIALQLPVDIEPGTDSPITIIYTEMPKLKDPETLSKIVALIAATNESTKYCIETFDASLKTLIQTHDIQTTESGEFAFDLITLRIKLSQRGVQSHASYPRYVNNMQNRMGWYSSNSHNFPHRPSERELKSIKWYDGAGVSEYNQKMSCSAQEQAENSLRKCSYAKFSVVIDFEKWLQTTKAPHAIIPK